LTATQAQHKVELSKPTAEFLEHHVRQTCLPFYLIVHLYIPLTLYTQSKWTIWMEIQLKNPIPPSCALMVADSLGTYCQYNARYRVSNTYLSFLYSYSNPLTANCCSKCYRDIQSRQPKEIIPDVKTHLERMFNPLPPLHPFRFACISIAYADFGFIYSRK
jgi:hypothetical protein